MIFPFASEETIISVDSNVPVASKSLSLLLQAVITIKAIEKIRYFILFIFIKLPIILGIIIHYRTGVVYYS